MTSCLEMVSFHLNDEADREAFLAAAPVVTEWVSRQPGFRHRSIVDRGEEGWVEMILWADQASAHSAAKKLRGETPFMAMIDRASVRMAHHTVVHTSPGV